MNSDEDILKAFQTYYETATLQLNPGLNGREIVETFKGADYQVLLVANKFDLSRQPRTRAAGR